MARNDFSIASVILSYFVVAGGIALGLVGVTLLELHSEVAVYGALAAGGAVGGFLAARASRGSTITEPAIGGVLVVATMVGIFVGTDIGELIWHVAQDQITKIVAIAGGAAVAGAIAGALVSEKLFGAHSQNSLAWLVYVAVAVLGASYVAIIVLMGAMLRGQASREDDATSAGIYFTAMGVGALLSGLAAGASAPRRILLVSLIASVIGVMGFFLLLRALPGVKADSDAAIGFAIIGVGCGLVTLVGSLIGWKTVGQRARG